MEKQMELWMVTNPYTGVRVPLTTEAKDFYVKIKELEKAINAHTNQYADNKERNKQINRFDKLRRMFSKLWTKEYNLLLD